MAEFLVLKQDTSRTPPWTVTQIVATDKEPSEMTVDERRAVVRQGYTGNGRYAVCRWDGHRESNLQVPAVPDVEDL